MPLAPLRRSMVVLATVVAVALTSLTAAQSAQADTAPTDPTAATSPPTVSADALPTPQINGVVWSQTIIGNTVFVGGNFTTAQPAGAAAGVNTVSRTYLLSYNLTTGVLNTGFAPVLNGQVKAVTGSPDGTRLYVGGAFTTVNGVNRYRVTALDPSTGAVVTSWAPGTNSTVSAIVATPTAVYLGGTFSSIGKDVRNKVGAVTASNGTNLAWDPNAAGGDVTALTISPDRTKVVVGGSFTSLGGSTNPGYGLASTDAVTGQIIGAFTVNNVIRNGGSQASITSLTSDSDSFYGSGYVFGQGGNLEGSFRADWATGNMVWMEDCHGDTYSAASTGTALYIAGHPHYCGNIAGFQQTPQPWVFHRALAFSKSATQTITSDPLGYYNFAGNPAPTLLNWYPDFNTGTFTGQSQGPWSVAANSQYVVYGGEFTQVNGKRQQGLTRFAVRSIAPNTQGPLNSGSAFKPSVVSLAAGTARVSFTANADRDNENLTYAVYRNGNLNTPVYTTTAASSVWKMPNLGFVDTGLTPGASYSYRVRATDPLGNTVIGDSVSVTVTAASPSPYTSAVQNDTPASFWRLGEASGTSVYDWVGFNDQVAGPGVTRGAAGAIGGDSNTASTFSGDGTGFSSTQTPVAGPQTFSLETWFKTTTTAGGKIVGFGNSSTGTSSSYDRHIYMTTDGRINFGVYNGNTQVLQSAGALNDGQWHQVVGTLSSTGMQLFVDGVRVGTRSDTTSAQPYDGFWRIGGDSSWSGSNFFAGDIDDVAVYNQVLNKQQVDAHFVASGRTSRLPQPPADNYGNRVYNDAPSVYWRLNDASGTVAADASQGLDPGVISGGVTTGAAGALAGNPDKAFSFDGQSGMVATSARIANPQTYSIEAWFNTTTTVGGKIIGFGSNQTGTSGSYDRHVYLQDNGQLVFGTYTGQLNTITTPGSYNDGIWHLVTASQSSDGLKLYVDGQLIGTNPQTQAQPYDGYWRIGGDNTWGSSSAFLNGRIDEAAVYDNALSAATVAQHYSLGTTGAVNQAPTASFSQATADLAATFDGTGSADPDGTVASYAWDFGDSQSATGATTSHTYAAAGTYTVSLTVTDNKGATGVFTNAVTVTAPRVNVAPTASFTSSVTNLALTVDGTGSADTDGTLTSYAWAFGDGSTATGANPPVHTYAAAGTYTVKLTVTDNDGATGVSQTTVTAVAAPPPNVPPTASFAATPTDLSVAFDASGSADSDGTIASYAWSFGDGQTATGPTPTHVYASAGTYSVKLTVTDNKGATGVSTGSVMVTAPPPANVPPVAAIDSTVSNLTANFSGAASTDSDGTISSYAWTFGDGQTGSGKTVSHGYGTAGTYTATLVVTDNSGATSTATQSVTVTNPPAMPFALDSFTRTVANGFGTADVGGAWTKFGTASDLAVNNGSAVFRLGAAGSQTGAYLNSVSQADTDLRVQFSLDKIATGGGTYLYAVGRKTATNNEYRAAIRLKNNGTAAVSLTALQGSATATTLASEVVVPGSIVAGTKLSLRLQVTGTSPTTIKAKVWPAGTTEPTAWTVQATDSFAGLQAPGGIGLLSYVSGTATNAPQQVTVQELSAFKP
ncbi:cell surface protein [Subtercola boreus]|uniref:Cell surface protein n=1 Tax=Subtercola boreus TaxID=120213 RepID=A0A3E0VTQ5_9MICO|nr:LamG domain-containing protein [Subtercola boreus]RFA13010.1 cell surface protein [Subtercola boreus]